MTRTIVLNTLAYQEVIEGNPAISQADLLDELKSAGFQYVEIRREYIHDGAVEIQKIAAKAQEKQLKLFYSVPDELFKQNEVNPALEGYFQEAQDLQALQVKVILGDLEHFTQQHADQIAAILERFSIKLLIENDQTTEKGSAAPLKDFIEQAADYGLSIGLTFDTGNFVYINEDPEESAKILKPFLGYVHIKNVKKTEAGIVITDSEAGDVNIQAILGSIPEDIPCAIEYPCGGRDHVLAKIVDERNNLLKMNS